MKIVVGSKNPAKIEAVQEVLADYPHLKDATIEAIDVDAGVADQPLSLDAVVDGAVNRAKNAYADGVDYSIGLESGLIPVKHAKSGYLDIGACAIYDGKEFHLGLTPAFEFTDPKVFRMVIDEGLNLSEAMRRAGHTASEYVGWEQGSVGIATKGRMTRKDQMKGSLITALVHIDP